ncbi:hypothetical protein [uncultured Mediterranean phage uvMED]|nr:hypothetical protein [uncultured Mediterranean phage uvMED]
MNKQTNKNEVKKMEKIIFNDCNELRVLAEEMLNKKANKIFLVKDDGAYLRQSHKRSQEDKNIFLGNQYGNLVAYGNWIASKNEIISLNPDLNSNVWDDTKDALGGDDFIEELDFSDEMLQFMEANTNYQIFVNISQNSIDYGIKQTKEG